MNPTDDDWFERERLHRAAADGDLPEVERLVRSGAEIDVFDDSRQTPLHHAAWSKGTPTRWDVKAPFKKFYVVADRDPPPSA